MSLISDVKTDVNMREITFSITAEALEAACEKVYQRQKKNIQVKGFRKGKVPRKMVEKFYGEEVFFEDAVNDLIPGELGGIIDAEKIAIVDRPSVELVSCSKAEGAVCKATLITKPEITLPTYEGLHAPMKVKEIEDSDIDAQVELIRQRQARVVDVEGRAAENNDEVKINFEGFIDGEAFEGGKGENYPLRLGSGQFIPGFEDQIVGHNIGDSFDVNVTFPENYGDERYAGKAAVFKTELLGITTQELPEVDDDFVKDVSEFDTVDQLREDIKKTLTERAEKTAETGFENAIFEQIIEGSEAIIPQVMVDRRIDQHVNDFENQLQQQYGDLKLDEYLQLTGMDINSLRDEYEPQAKKEVKLRLALEKIADEQNIVISDEELEEEITAFAGRIGAPVEFVKSRIPKDDYVTDLRINKAVEFLKSRAVVDNDMAEETPAEETAEAAAEAPAESTEA